MSIETAIECIAEAESGATVSGDDREQNTRCTRRSYAPWETSRRRTKTRGSPSWPTGSSSGSGRPERDRFERLSERLPDDGE